MYTIQLDTILIILRRTIKHNRAIQSVGSAHIWDDNFDFKLLLIMNIMIIIMVIMIIDYEDYDFDYVDYDS